MKSSFVIVMSLATVLVAGAAFAQSDAVVDPGHPRINEVDQRLQTQQARTDAAIANGRISGAQAINDQNRDAAIAARAQADEARQGGHLTAAQTARLNGRLDNNSAHIYDQHTGGAAAPVVPAQ